ncbi:MAG: alanine racemase [Gemmatimonadales bacterium]
MTTPFTPETTRAWVDVDLAALAANARTIAAVSGRPLLPMVKANGYGLGAIEVAKALDPLEPWGFGVALVEEGAGLRSAGISRPILVVSPLLAGEVDRYLAHDLRPSIGDPVALTAWTSRSARPFHIEVDTGMSRAGVRWDDLSALTAMRGSLETAPGWEGVFTHFHSAESDTGSVSAQWDRLQGVVAALPRRPSLVHAANSAAALRGKVFAADLIRPGIFLYGGEAGVVTPRTVVVLRARVVALRTVREGGTVSYGATWRAPRESTIATLSLGYADGFPRATRETSSPSDRPPRLVEVGGHTAEVVGRVTMDQTMIATEGPVSIGDVATVYGGIVSLDQQARAAGTISYELLTALGSRLPRLYSSS